MDEDKFWESPMFWRLAGGNLLLMGGVVAGMWVMGRMALNTWARTKSEMDGAPLPNLKAFSPENKKYYAILAGLVATAALGEALEGYYKDVHRQKFKDA